MKFSFDFLNDLGFSLLMESGREPWKMYFSFSGSVLKTSGASLKFSPATACGVWEAKVSIELKSKVIFILTCANQSVSRNVDSSEKWPSSKIRRNSVPLGLRPCNECG